MRRTPGSSPLPSVALTWAGKPPRASTHCRISSRLVVVFDEPEEVLRLLPPRDFEEEAFRELVPDARLPELLPARDELALLDGAAFFEEAEERFAALPPAFFVALFFEDVAFFEEALLFFDGDAFFELEEEPARFVEPELRDGVAFFDDLLEPAFFEEAAFFELEAFVDEPPLLPVLLLDPDDLFEEPADLRAPEVDEDFFEEDFEEDEPPPFFEELFALPAFFDEPLLLRFDVEPRFDAARAVARLTSLLKRFPFSSERRIASLSRSNHSKNSSHSISSSVSSPLKPGKSMRRMPGSLRRPVARTRAGCPPRSSTHRRISSWSVVGCAVAIPTP
jgi:hypothetical protein